MDFDGQRWYDEREIGKLWRDYSNLKKEDRLPSDSCNRDDLQLLEMGDV